MRRQFTKCQRRVLAWVAGGTCQKCGKQLTNSFHADHVVPFVRGGLTTLQNGQALCIQCNLAKGAQ